MNKVFLFITFLAITVLATAQTPQIDKLKKDLKSHKRQDVTRVHMLNELAADVGLNYEERKEYADEALAISKNIKYAKGQGFAWVLLGSIMEQQGNISEGESMFLLADSVADLTGSLELKANVLWRKSNTETDTILVDSLLQQAYSLAIKAGDLLLQARINFSMGKNTKDLQKREALYSKVVSLAEKSGDVSYLADVLRYIGNDLATIGSENALNYLLMAEETAERPGNEGKLSSLQRSIGYYYLTTLTDYAKAMQYFLKGLSSAETANDTLRIMNSWIDLGLLYSYLDDRENALSYFLKAEVVNKNSGKEEIESRLQSSLGENYRLSGKYPEAINAYNKAIEIYRDQNRGFYIYVDESNLADVYTRMGILDSAFYYGFKSLKTNKELGDINGEGWVDGLLARAYLKKNMADSAIYYGQLGLAAAKQTGTIEYMRDNTLALANAYAAQKDFEKAYSNHLLYLNYRDSMMNAEVRNRTAVQQYTFNLDKKEAQIAVLHEQKKGQRNLLIGAIVLLGLILAVAGLLLRNNRLKQKANAQLKKQKQEIDDKARKLSEQKDNVELLSDIGRKITSSLSIEKIIGTVYKNVNTLMDANVFGIGIYNGALKKIEFPATYENGQPLPFYSNAIDDETRFGAVCFTSGKEIIIGNLDEEYKDHIQQVSTPHEGGVPTSIIFLPLMSKGEKLGVITVQSFHKNAYSDYQLFMLRNIATYAAIAIENAESYDELNNTLSTLRATQTQLIQSEKMASLGELTAGIAHEIQNPLNFVNNFSEVSSELIDEMNEELDREEIVEAKSIAKDLKLNLEKINHHGQRASSIVKGMLEHSRSSDGKKELTDINVLADEYLRLSYHGLRAKDKTFNAGFKTDFDDTLPKINMVPQDIGRVLLNLINNAFYACSEKQKVVKDLSEPSITVRGPVSSDEFASLTQDSNYKPMVIVSTRSTFPTGVGGVNGNERIEIKITDNGFGIPPDIKDKIFQPFFTTKPTGKGTGLGLSLSYDIIKAHGGELKVESEEGKGSTFIIQLSAG